MGILNIELKWTLKLPLYGLLVDLGLYALSCVFYVLAAISGIKVFEDVFFVWMKLHVPISLYFGSYFRDDYPTTYLLMGFVNTISVCFLVGLIKDIAAYKKI